MGRTKRGTQEEKPRPRSRDIRPRHQETTSAKMLPSKKEPPLAGDAPAEAKKMRFSRLLIDFNTEREAGIILRLVKACAVLSPCAQEAEGNMIRRKPTAGCTEVPMKELSHNITSLPRLGVAVHLGTGRGAFRFAHYAPHPTPALLKWKLAISLFAMQPFEPSDGCLALRKLMANARWMADKRKKSVNKLPSDGSNGCLANSLFNETNSVPREQRDHRMSASMATSTATTATTWLRL
ncbi:hypothetical protein C8J57DRAFT_1240205 [Mycena rebaudengoi]|nr:hypothetical protein C8J57DRAFT_1240205 [Mycena rebaudengoi]